MIAQRTEGRTAETGVASEGEGSEPDSVGDGLEFQWFYKFLDFFRGDGA